jgi:predicted transport protein
MRYWTTRELRELYAAWRDGIDIDVLCVRYGRSAAALRVKLARGGVKRSREKLREVRKIAQSKKAV